MQNPGFEDIITSIEQALDGSVTSLTGVDNEYPVEGSQVGINPTNQC